jgi:DeoR/GlpR family transcriptional regulator of sugar metabolism
VSNQQRLEQIVRLVEEQGFLSVAELSRLCQVSEMTIRRDLTYLDEQKRIQRTYGGAAPLRGEPGATEPFLFTPSEGALVDRVDVVIATALNPKYDGLLLNSIGTNKKAIPIVAESLSINNNEVTVVTINNYAAGLALGRWAGHYSLRKLGGKARILDLTYYLSNTQARSRGFIDGLREVNPTCEVVLSIDAQSRYDTAYQLTRDALTVHGSINLIFAINDTIAWGAVNACEDLQMDPNKVAVLPFGLEGDTLKNALVNDRYVKAGLAMFPEIVGPVCIEAAIAAYNDSPLPTELITPYAVLDCNNLFDYYHKGDSGWELVRKDLSVPLDIDPDHPRRFARLPRRIGLIVPFREHEWYQSLIRVMLAYTRRYRIEFENIDVNQSLKDEVDLRRREIARLAARQVEPGDVILIDGGPITDYLAEALLEKRSITVITNALPVFNILRANPEINLILTGGIFRQSSQVLVGPTAEGALRELRADKLFLTVTGISLNFGLSHTNISEVTLKQAMIRSAKEVILLADHTYFGHESVIQVAPAATAHKLITDDALPASVRLELTKLGIQIILAKT